MSEEGFNETNQGSGGGRVVTGGRNKKKTKITFIISACVLIAALAVFAVIFLGNQKETARILDSGTALKGVSVGGIDISGMTREQALAATAGLEGKLLDAVKFTLSVNGQDHQYTAYDFCLTTDYQDALDKALEYGHTGSFEQRLNENQKASGEGVDFKVTLSVDQDKLKAELANIKQQLDVAPKDAAVTFTPWGHTADGKAFSPDIKEIKSIVEAEAYGNIYSKYPDLVKISDSDMPNKLRYKYWENSKFVADYTPPGANISRFVYNDPVTGISAKTDEILDDIVGEVQSGDYSSITVPCDVTEPAVTLDTVKQNTQLISSFTTSFSKKTHYNYKRNWNVAMISSLINNGGSAPAGQPGSIVRPGETWSANGTAGPRDSSTAKTIGWKTAAGIQDGGFNPQIGGGVCQLGSTTYNAALRSGITVAEFNHHSIPSDYVPIGLDATLNTKPALDLKLKNDNATWNYYIVSYVNPKDKDVTVEIYGPPIVDPTYGNVIYDYTSKKLGSYGAGKTKTVHTKTSVSAPDGTVINVDNQFYKYSVARSGRTAEVWRVIYDLSGNQLAKIVFSEEEKYPPTDGVTYVYDGPGSSPSPGATTDP